MDYSKQQLSLERQIAEIEEAEIFPTLAKLEPWIQKHIELKQQLYDLQNQSQPQGDSELREVRPNEQSHEVTI